MPSKAMEELIERAVSDEAFAEQLRTDPAGALAGYDLTEDEKGALGSRDADRIRGLGVDERISKIFIKL